MRNFLSRLRAPTTRTRAAVALAAAGALVLSSGLAMMGSATADPGGSPPGNNGTVKVGDTGDIDEQRPENDPHLPCTFTIQWANFDAGWTNISSTVSFELQAPTDAENGNTMSVTGDTSPVIVGNGEKPGAGDGYDRLVTYSASFTGAPHEQQGYHVKIIVSTPHSKGAEKKHKVFWVGPCGIAPTVISAGVVPHQASCDTNGQVSVDFVNEDKVTYVLTSQPPAPGVTSTWTATIKDPSTYTFAGGATRTEVSATFAPFDPSSCQQHQTVSATVVFHDPDCVSSSAGWTGYVDGKVDSANDHVTFAVTSGTVAPGEPVTVTATAAQGWRFPDGSSTNTFDHRFGPVPTGCEQQVPVPAAPVVTPPTCSAPGSYTLPDDTEAVDWSITPAYAGPGAYTVTARTTPGYEFADSTTVKEWTVQVLVQLTGDECILGKQEITPVVTFRDPTCTMPARATWNGTFTDLVDYTVKGAVEPGGSVVVTATLKAAAVEDYTFPAGYDAAFEHSYPSLGDLDCVKGTETATPKPKLTVLGTQTVVPTAVNAGVAGIPADPSSGPPAQALAGAGLVLMLGAAWLGFGRREYGGHEA